jgi:hypothetical protein
MCIILKVNSRQGPEPLTLPRSIVISLPGHVIAIPEFRRAISYACYCDDDIVWEVEGGSICHRYRMLFIVVDVLVDRPRRQTSTPKVFTCRLC